MEWKICRRCKKEIPLEHFYKNKGNKDGFTTRCIECIKEAKKDLEVYKKENKIKTREMWIKEGEENMKIAYNKYRVK